MTTLTKNQTKFFDKEYVVAGKPRKIVAEVRYDDQCGNGHNTFSITGTTYSTQRSPGETPIKSKCGRNLYPQSMGCIHDKIAKHFPQLRHMIKWHLTSSDGPMHYPANALYHASDRDHNGKAAGEACAWSYGVRFNDVPVTHVCKSGNFYKFLQERRGTGDFQVIAIAHPPAKPGEYEYAEHYTFVGYGDKWHECPFSNKAQADEFCAAMNTCKVEFVKIPTDFSKGKARELNHARSCAVWPEATDEELCADDLKEKLLARLPALMEQFRADVEAMGFVW